LPLDGDASGVKQEALHDATVDDYQTVDESDDDAADDAADVPDFGVVDAALILSTTKGAKRQRRKRKLWNIMKEENRIPEHCLPPSAVATMKQHASTKTFQPTCFMCLFCV